MVLSCPTCNLRIEIDSFFELVSAFNMNIIYACGKNGEFGYENKLPWNQPFKHDMKHFKERTRDQIVIMGYNTFHSLLTRRGLSDRTNIIIDKAASLVQFDIDLNAYCVDTLSSALLLSLRLIGKKKIYLIGGKKLIEEAFSHPYCKQVYVTRIDESFEHDVKIDETNLFKSFEMYTKSDKIAENGISYHICLYEKIADFVL